MARERVDYDYSGRPLTPLSEMDHSNVGEYEGGITLTKTKDGRWVVDMGPDDNLDPDADPGPNEYYLADANGLPLWDHPIDPADILS